MEQWTKKQDMSNTPLKTHQVKEEIKTEIRKLLEINKNKM